MAFAKLHSIQVKYKQEVHPLLVTFKWLLQVAVHEWFSFI